MTTKKIQLGNQPIKSNTKNVTGTIVTLNDTQFYKISNYNHMNPFFMSIVSHADLWMFIWSNGALSAGRKNPDNALFPYYTDDKIKDSSENTGSKSIFLIETDEKQFLWEPFSDKYPGIYNIERNCYKNIYGNKVIFEEINHDLQLNFQYTWTNSQKYGFIKKSTLINQGSSRISVHLLDGIQNILPYGIQQRFQNEYSTLADGYKKNERVAGSSLALYTMSSIPVDKAEPSESLKATTVWSTGIDAKKILISSRQLDQFRNGKSLIEHSDIRAARGAYFINADITLDSQMENHWFTVAELAQDAKAVSQLQQALTESAIGEKELLSDIDLGTKELTKYVARADGLQKTGDDLNRMRHFSNTLFNIMRGGLFADNYIISKADLLTFINTANRACYQRNKSLLTRLPDNFSQEYYLKLIEKVNDSVLEKLSYEYLPLIFSRRHGDPSRPWNRFSIEIKDAKGDDILNYQGNWRDIFQNWEALALSYPNFLESMISKFVNASTVDGYNPYRVTKNGFDWEIVDPDDPWSYIGYWGDHQIVYLMKLLELSIAYNPDKLQHLLHKKIFTYANVPYRLKSYGEIQQDPHNTVDFDDDLQEKIETRVKKIGEDGKLVLSDDQTIYQVTLAEKLLVPILAKLSNFIPEAGIWMNTQRPEWNDANNALVGYGVSMVTLYYLRKHLTVCKALLFSANQSVFHISEEVTVWFSELHQVFTRYQALLADNLSGYQRKKILDELESAAETYRNKVYNNGFSGNNSSINGPDLAAFFDLAIKYLDHTIRANRREDNLFHSYNLMEIDENQVNIRYLYKMLEGQVAVLSSNFLSVKESLALLNALRQSDLYRADQNTYLLYPDRQLPRFLEKNNLEAADVPKVIKDMVENNDNTILMKDQSGTYHFNGNFRNAKDLEVALQNTVVNAEERQKLLDLFEATFNHKAFTGRSGTFYKYEGLGCTYWHMVSKLLLSVGDLFNRAVKEKSSLSDDIKRVYYGIRDGIGVRKSPEKYGAFPTDAYSHTPSFTGVQQPGLTGQVKEDVISRFNELGVIVTKGKISFQPKLLLLSEFLSEEQYFYYYTVSGKKNRLNLQKDTLAFTIAQVPVIYKKNSADYILITHKNNDVEKVTAHQLSRQSSSKIFHRSGEITKIEVFFKK